MSRYTWKEKLPALLVHIFTASGIIFALMAIIAVTDHNWKLAYYYLVVTLIIDGIDGTFARKCNVKEVLPNFDGKVIDNIIDFTTYATIPAFIIYEAFPAEGLLTDWTALPLACMVVLISALYYGRDGMISSDLYFIGFPVMWNLVVFYLLFVYTFSPWVNAGFIILFAILHFVPIKYVYPSRTKSFQKLNILNTIFCIGSACGLLYIYPHTPEMNSWHTALVITSTVTLLYFGFLSIYSTYFVSENK